MREFDVVESRFFGLWKKTYKMKLSNKKYYELIQKKHVEDTLNMITSLMPVMVATIVTKKIMGQMSTKERKQI